MKKSFYIIILGLIILNSFVFYYSSCIGEYIQGTSIWGNSYLINKKSLSQVSDIIKTLPEEEPITALIEKIKTLNSYEYAVRYNEGDSSVLYYWDDTPNRRTAAENTYKKYLSSEYKDNISKLDSDIASYKLTREYLSYKLSYADYIESIQNIADDLLTIKLYENNEAWISSNILKTKKDFYGLEKVTISLDTSEGINVIIDYKISDVFAILACITAALISFVSLKHKTGSTLLTRKYNFLHGVLFLSLVIIIIYGMNIIMTERFIGIGDLNRSIQSLESFKSCTLFLNTGNFLFFWILSNLTGCLIIYFAVLFCAVSLRGIHQALLRIIPMSLFFAAEFILYNFNINPESSLFIILKEINIFSAFDLHRFFTRYFNLDVFNTAVSRLTVFTIFIIVVFLIFIISAHKGIGSYKQIARTNAERVYYDEINNRYAEFRSIWHDMQNHLLTLNRLIESNDTDSAKNYINEVSENLEKNLLPVKTGKHGSVVLDALLFKKLETAKQKDIELKYNINVSPCDFGISDYELCCIFGNILDNSIEAVENLKCNDRTISLTTGRHHEMLYICCENPYINELNEDKRKGLFLTTKADKKHHGIGLSRVNRLAGKHNGSVKISTENNLFKIEILLNSSENNTNSTKKS